MEIPELEFELSQDGKKHIDSIYNHLAGAVYNLGSHISGTNAGLSDDHRHKISECLGQVRVCGGEVITPSRAHVVVRMSR